MAPGWDKKPWMAPLRSSMVQISVHGRQDFLHLRVTEKRCHGILGPFFVALLHRIGRFPQSFAPVGAK